jgi:uncharacterized protein
MQKLNQLGMEKGLIYETIISTSNKKERPNAAPIGVICKGNEKIVIYLYEGSHTLKNIKTHNRFIVNITKDPLIFAECTTNDPDKKYFDKYKNDFYIKDADAFIMAVMTSQKSFERENHLGKSRINIIEAQVKEIVIRNKCAEPINRATNAIIEALIYLTRIGLSEEEVISNEYSNKIREYAYLVSRVGGLKHKKAMNKILKHMEKLND